MGIQVGARFDEGSEHHDLEKHPVVCDVVAVEGGVIDVRKAPGTSSGRLGRPVGRESADQLFFAHAFLPTPPLKTATGAKNPSAPREGPRPSGPHRNDPARSISSLSARRAKTVATSRHITRQP